MRENTNNDRRVFFYIKKFNNMNVEYTTIPYCIHNKTIANNSERMMTYISYITKYFRISR